MSEQSPVPLSPDAPVPQAERRVSGLIVGGLLLSVLVGFFWIPVLGGIFGLLLCFLGWRQAIRDPRKIGPRFGLVAMVVALLATLFQTWLFLPISSYAANYSDFIHSVRRGIEARDAEKLSELSFGEGSRQIPVEAIQRELAEMFPEAENAVSITGDFEIREADIRKDLDRTMPSVGEHRDLVLPYRIPTSAGPVHLDLTYRTLRTGYMDFELQLLEFDLSPVPPPKIEAVPGEAGQASETGEAAESEGPAEPESVPDETGD